MAQGDLANKVALVTGGGSGIGRAIARCLAEAGAAVCLAGRDRAKLETVATSIVQQGGEAWAVLMDVAQEPQVVEAVARVYDRWGRLDILVNNAGIGGPTKPVWELRLEEWNEVLAVDLTGPMLVCREVLKHMVPASQGGVIINIGSEGGRAGDGRSGYPRRAPYCCAKMGLIGLTETLARECGPSGIRVNCVTPAAVRGERFERMIRGRAEATRTSFEEALAAEMRMYSLGRPAEEEEIGRVVAFLASDAAAAITGQTIPVNCGMNMWG